MSMLEGPRWRATRTFAEDSATLTISEPYNALRLMFDKPESEIDGDAAQRAIVEFIPRYYRAKDRLVLLRTATGLDFEPNNLLALKEAELRAIDAIQDMQASPAATHLKHVNPDHLR